MNFIRNCLLLLLLLSGSTLSAQFELNSKDSLNGNPKNSIVFSGFVNSIFYYDFVGINDAYPALNITTVPVGDFKKEPYTNFNAFQTRLRFNSTHQTEIGEIKLYVEGDYVSGSGAFRLRHALISVGKWDVGQIWSNFADEDAWPNMTDYDGPPTGIWARPTVIRYNAIEKEKYSLAFSLEGPSLDYQTNYEIDSTISTTNQNVPDFTVRYRYETDRFHFQLSGVYRNIRYKNLTDTSLFYEKGFGLSASTGITVFGKDRFHAQATFGKGISRYLVGFEARNLDAVVVGTNKIELLPTVGGFIGYDHFWNKKKSFSSTIVLGLLYVQNNIDKLSYLDDFLQGSWGALNLYWYPVDKLSVAIEYTANFSTPRNWAKIILSILTAIIETKPTIVKNLP